MILLLEVVALIAVYVMMSGNANWLYSYGSSPTLSPGSSAADGVGLTALPGAGDDGRAYDKGYLQKVAADLLSAVERAASERRTPVAKSGADGDRGALLTGADAAGQARAGSLGASNEVPRHGRFAYVFYATDESYMCASIIAGSLLRKLNVDPSIDITVMLDKQSLQRPAMARLVEKARAPPLSMTLAPVTLLQQPHGDPTWKDSLTKLRVFELTQYDRIVYFDTDGLPLRNMDHLFQLPAAPIAMPRAYWLRKEQPFMSSQFMVLEPAPFRLQHMLEALKDVPADKPAFDMDVLNDLYKHGAMVLPHEYDVLSGVFRWAGKPKSQALFYGNAYEKWNATEILESAYFVHFSDWPLSKPWLTTLAAFENSAPACPPYCEEAHAIKYIFGKWFAEKELMQC